jgi:hypothetical protein
VIDVAGVSLAVDVGGATGDLIRELMRVNPGLRGLVIDLPQAAEAARRAADADGLGDRFSAVAGDFFAGVPAADLFCSRRSCTTGTTIPACASCETAVKPLVRGRGWSWSRM